MEFLILAFTIFVFAITPGPGTLALLSISTSRGLIASVFFSIGMTFGDLTYLTMVIFSLNALASFIDPIINVVQYFGASYLFYLGYLQWKAGGINTGDEIKTQSNIKELFTGYLMAGTNPKVIIFYLSVLPILIDLSQATLHQGLQIIFTVAFSLMAGFVAIGVLGKKLKKLISSPKMALRVNRIFGAVMIGVGLSLFYF